MNEKPKHTFRKFVEEIPIIAIKGFVGCLAIGLPLELRIIINKVFFI